jgi:hypothetical protein
MNIYLSEVSGGISEFKQGDEIGIFDGTHCVGSTVVSNTKADNISIAVSADDPTTQKVDGYMNGHMIMIKAWRPGNNVEVTMPSVECLAGSNVFEPMGTSWINLATIALNLNAVHVFNTGLGDSYPNPFVTSTTIPFTLGEESAVDIAIYNLLGERLNTLIHQTLSPGDYKTLWSITDMNNHRVMPGIYLCKMVVGDKVFVKRIEVIETR